ncbi:MAG TPA: polyprenyl synthetase family protein [Prolixibacteraceae bacterium]|nr:MAG: (2E,6E)-farnesyl diphosphate synthase [Bacteroidetes bacterium ADurb.Bin123]HOF54735.1 polyprenyl synthetase family protein [Prolixibacteraceae bacterium]HOR99706.1 polyprenyl synthetase family protein [Prolixibacteraceae bacterium]HOS89122.1 polyprenyl synthetase family protein [Prolixibacteraceae bacterium]HPL44250.1 polyprenyl synthetase family protein [Prolixibacteraceae bacterium]
MKDTDQLKALVEGAVQNHLQQWRHKHPENLYAPVCYALEAGGKRLRPLLVLVGYQIFGDHVEEALPAALAIEVFHNFTLLHDDIMDKSEIRRNQPTVHIRFSDNNAILSGDAMAFLAYSLLMELKSNRLEEVIALFTRTAVEICEGQQMDMDFEARLDVSVEEYLEMIRLKTAVLMACSLKSGALLGGSTDEEADLLYEAGINLGLAFQLQDDYLDTSGDETTFGKKIGGDILADKKTFLLTEALRSARGTRREELISWLGRDKLPGDRKIKAIQSIFADLQIKEKTLLKIGEYSSKAIATLSLLKKESFRKEPLLALFSSLIKREH